jgi:hypothetical protein
MYDSCIIMERQTKIIFVKWIVWQDLNFLDWVLHGVSRKLVGSLTSMATRAKTPDPYIKLKEAVIRQL